MDFATARRMMVDGQVRTSDVTNPDLIAAMAEIPRERFVPASKANIAYLDLDLPVSDGDTVRRLLKPMVLAKLIQAAEVRRTDKVLDVGCATGYSSAVLAKVAAAVVALDEDADLVRTAEAVLTQVGVKNVTVVQGPLTDGWAERGPYDVILLNGMTEVLPDALCYQLKDGGRLVGVFGGETTPRAMVYLLERQEVSGRTVFDATAPLLPGFAKPAAFVF
jgi:protein-L-isoaspartate(D-aspartate) O-methyltransferase